MKDKGRIQRRTDIVDHVMGWLCIALVAFIIVTLPACTAVDKDEWRCQFDRISGVYHTSTMQVNGRSNTIIVYKDGKSYAFNRSQVTVCEKVEGEYGS